MRLLGRWTWWSQDPPQKFGGTVVHGGSRDMAPGNLGKYGRGGGQEEPRGEPRGGVSGADAGPGTGV